MQREEAEAAAQAQKEKTEEAQKEKKEEARQKADREAALRTTDFTDVAGGRSNHSDVSRRVSNLYVRTCDSIMCRRCLRQYDPVQPNGRTHLRWRCVDIRSLRTEVVVCLMVGTSWPWQGHTQWWCFAGGLETSPTRLTRSSTAGGSSGTAAATSRAAMERQAASQAMPMAMAAPQTTSRKTSGCRAAWGPSKSLDGYFAHFADVV